ncbi:MAG: 50S ribosomal protein L11 methyltransferase [Actinomycetota bacterium]|nr:50S ribosomal protein L11 methyltransferase [Actinomycetota bacterium]
MIRLVLACARGEEAEEIARAAVLERFAEGVEERRAAGGGLELAVYCADRPDHLPEVAGEWSEEPVADGWEDGWRAFHTGRTVAGRLWVGPPWETPPPGLPAVVIDPGRAFGTGAHATTLLCLELLLGQRPGPLLDLGCGSGVLALAAARLGHAPVLACDDDPDAVEVARENAARNDCDIQVWQCDALYDELPKAIDLWLANLQRAPLEELAWRPDLPARLIVSGLLEGEPFQPPGYRIAARRSLDGWEGLLLEREAAA